MSDTENISRKNAKTDFSIQAAEGGPRGGAPARKRAGDGKIKVVLRSVFTGTAKRVSKLARTGAGAITAWQWTAQNGQAVHAYVTQSDRGTWLFQGQGHQGANS